jgi:tRNA(fMet)-specific endonuclease VapC
MKYLLDTNTCIRYINGRAPKLRLKLPTIPMVDVVVCDIVVAELFYGAAKSSTPTESLAKQQAFLQPYISLPFDGKAAMHYGFIRAQLEKQGTPIGSLDMLIAAIVFANDLILVTHNTTEFRRVSDLKIEDWED